MRAAALASGALTDADLTEGLTRLNGAIASLRTTLGSLGVKGVESIADIASTPGVPGADGIEGR